MASTAADGLRSDGEDRVPALEIYKAAIDEYRFQATYNWSRTQYMLVFNTGILAAAAAVASRPGHSAALIFGLGVVACVVSYFLIHTQQDYYRAARDRMRHVEENVGVPEDMRTNTTSTLGGRNRLVSVNQLVTLLLGALCIADIVGAAIVGLR